MKNNLLIVFTIIFLSAPIRTIFSQNGEISLLSPADVHLSDGDRFGNRYKGNIDYLLYQYKHFGEFMIESFATRHYSPGKLLERVWDGEYAGKWLDAAVRTAVNTGDESLLKLVDRFAASLREKQQKSGYMGIPLPTDRKLNEWEKDWDLWCQWTSMIGLLTHYELRGDKASLKCASAIAEWVLQKYSPIEDKNSDFFNTTVTDGKTRMAITGQLMRLYYHTGNEELVNFVRDAIYNYPPTRDMIETGKPFLAHPYMLSAILTGVIEYAHVKKDYEMFAKIEKVWDGLVESYLFPTGSLGESENLVENRLEDVPGGQLQETCATTEWIFLTQRLYELTGKEKYVAALEQTSYNALIGAQSDDGMKWCYFTPLRYNKQWFHGPTRCCFWSGPRGIARIPQMIYASGDNVIYVNFFESSTADFSTSSGRIMIKQESEFPDRGYSTLSIQIPEDAEVILRLRVPRWAENYEINLNGNTIAGESNEKGYRDITLNEYSTNSVGLSFDLPLIRDRFSEGHYSFRRGPEVLSIDVRDNLDTWLGQDDLISIPSDKELSISIPEEKIQWPGPEDDSNNRRRYFIKLDDKRTSELRGVYFTPFADAGNEGAAFRTIFPLTGTVTEDD